MSQDNININVSETNDIVNIVSSEVTEVIDINVGETIEEVTLNITEEIIQVNINKVTGGGGNQTLAQTLVFGNQTDGTDILLNNEDAIALENGSLLQKGSFSFGSFGDVIVSGITNANDGYINGIMGWGNPSGTLWSDLNGTYIKTSVAVTPSGFQSGDIGMHTPVAGTFNYYLAPVGNSSFNGIAYFLAPGNRSGWSDPNNDSYTDIPVNFWRLCSLSDYPTVYFTNPSSDAYNFPTSGWVPVDETLPNNEGGYGYTFIANYGGGFTTSISNIINGDGGISRICSVGYEDMWQSGIRYVFDNNGYIRNATNCFTTIPNSSFDNTQRFKVGSIWTLDDGTNYICTDTTTDNAVWDIYNAIPTNTSDLNNDSDFVSDASYVHTDNNFTTAEQTKLAGIEAGAEVNVNADWNATSGDAQILNKPSIPAAQIQSDWNQTNNASLDYIKNKPSLTGFGDMLKSTYDVDNTGIVDNAEAIKIIGRNSTGSTLYRGTIIYISGSTGNRPNFVKARANSEATSAGTFGVIADDLANNTDGYALCLGYLDNLDTRTNATHPFTSDTLADGDTIYLSPTTAGYITNVKPSAPDHLVYLGKVTRTHPSLGTIVYRVQNGYELEELHNVAISSVANYDGIFYNSSTSLWENKNVSQVLPERRNANKSSDNNINYCGMANKGSAEASAVWTIKRLTIGTSGSITIATATNVAWTNRESATYT